MVKKTVSDTWNYTNGYANKYVYHKPWKRLDVSEPEWEYNRYRSLDF